MLIKLHLPVSRSENHMHSVTLTVSLTASLTAGIQAKREKNDEHIQYPKLFITKLRMAFLPSFQESLKRSNDNRTTLPHTQEKKGDTQAACLWVINT